MLEKILRSNFMYISETQAFVPIYPIKEMICELKIENNLFVIVSNNIGFQLSDDKYTQFDCRIHCQKENFIDLLDKKIRLQQMLEDPNVMFEGKYKHLLLLESVFAFFKELRDINKVTVK